MKSGDCLIIRLVLHQLVSNKPLHEVIKIANFDQVYFYLLNLVTVVIIKVLVRLTYKSELVELVPQNLITNFSQKFIMWATVEPADKCNET